MPDLCCEDLNSGKVIFFRFNRGFAVGIVTPNERNVQNFRFTRWAYEVYCLECKFFDAYKRDFTMNQKVRCYSCDNCDKNFTDSLVQFSLIFILL